MKTHYVRLSADGRTILIKTVYYQDNKWVVGGNINGKDIWSCRSSSDCGLR
jgi:hypothetical protein